MSIDDDVKRVLAEEKEREKDTRFQGLREFYETMKKKGLVVKQEYNLPPVDTIDRSLYTSREEPARKGYTPLAML